MELLIVIFFFSFTIFHFYIAGIVVKFSWHPFFSGWIHNLTTLHITVCSVVYLWCRERKVLFKLADFLISARFDTNTKWSNQKTLSWKTQINSSCRLKNQSDCETLYKLLSILLKKVFTIETFQMCSFYEPWLKQFTALWKPWFIFYIQAFNF